MATDATEHFHHSSEWHVICKDCQYAVWPSQIVGHLTNKQHALPRKVALSILDDFEQWPGVALFPGEFWVQDSVTAPVKGLSIYNDRVKCEVNDGACKYVCRDPKTMKEHWRKVYGVSAGQRRGRLGRLREEEIWRQISQYCRQVRCQHFFVQKENPHYFEVQSTPDTDRRGSSRDQAQET